MALSASTSWAVIMFGLNSFFSASNAAQYADRLFEKTSIGKDAFQAKPLLGANDQSKDVFVASNSASDRAMARIIEILWNAGHGETQSGDQPKVDEVGGYILEATGTGRDDKIDLKGMATYNLSSGAGNDTVTIKAGSLVGLDAGDGNDQIHLAVGYSTMVDGGGGDDIVQMSGRLAHDISGGEGNDTLKISANTILNIDGGAGNDTIYLEGERIFAGGGTGDDMITIHNKSERPSELRFAKGDGKDIVNSDGPIHIRLGFDLEDLLITTEDNVVTITARQIGDNIRLNFAPGALDETTPQFEFELRGGDYVLKVF